MDFITTDENDDPVFIANCEKIIRKYLQLWKPRELFITGVNSIFDSGWATEEEKLFSFWSHGNELSISLFHPNIVSSTSIYQDSYRGYYVSCKVSDYIKKRKEGEYRLFEVHYSPLKQYYFPTINNGLLVWYSKNSLSNNKGTLMFHYTNGIEIKILHVTFSKSENWNVSESFGISKSESQEIINNNNNN